MSKQDLGSIVLCKLYYRRKIWVLNMVFSKIYCWSKIGFSLLNWVSYIIGVRSGFSVLYCASFIVGVRFGFSILFCVSYIVGVRSEAELKNLSRVTTQIWMVQLKIVFNVSRFKQTLNCNRFLVVLRRGSNSLNSDTVEKTTVIQLYYSCPIL